MFIKLPSALPDSWHGMVFCSAAQSDEIRNSFPQKRLRRPSSSVISICSPRSVSIWRALSA